MNMNKKEPEAFAKEAAKGIKTPEDLNEFSQMLKKITVEAALNAEMDEHLGYEKHQKSTSSNSRNGKSSKRVKTEDGEFELDTTPPTFNFTNFTNLVKLTIIHVREHR